MNEPNNLTFEHLPSIDEISNNSFMPWEQRLAPGMSIGSSSGSHASEAESHLERLPTPLATTVLSDQTTLASYTLLPTHTIPESDLDFKTDNNHDVWKQFNQERLFDTRRVTLEHFHLFEWFPRAPGLFHTHEAQIMREAVLAGAATADHTRVTFNPISKERLIVNGGVGSVRLRPRLATGADGFTPQPYYFMTASSTGICHEGFPILIPRKLYAPLKMQVLDEGAVPVNLRGEMRYIPDSTALLDEQLPQLYLHVDEIDHLAQPRANVTRYLISAAVSFFGRFQNQDGFYMTYVTFDPARNNALIDAVEWLSRYANDDYAGQIVTDFDEQRRHFSDATFSLEHVTQGKVRLDVARQLLERMGFSVNEINARTEQIIRINQYIDTQSSGVQIHVEAGGSLHIEGDVIGGNQEVR